MDKKSNPLANLAHQLHRGKEGSEQRFWQEMGPQLERMVRRVVRFGPGRSVLEQTIDREVAQTRANPHSSLALDAEKVIGVVTRRLFQEMLERLQSGSGPGRPLLDTQASLPRRDCATRLERVEAA